MTDIKPIIIFGTGRSGTTIFHQMLCEHPQLAWLSGLSNNYPDKPVLNRAIMQSLEYPILGKFIKNKFIPGESYDFWDFYSPGFSTPYRDLNANDVSIKQKKNIIKAMSQLTTEKRNRLLLKVTGWPRIGFLSEVFNDAIFIHVIRDGRAVANSLINIDFWRGWEGDKKWRWGDLSETYKKEWDNHNQSFIALAAIQWKILMDSAESAINAHEKSTPIIQIKYEDLCDDPISSFKKITEFCGLDWNTYFENKLKTYKLKNTNKKYEKELNNHQRIELNSILNDYLKKYDYI